ncbi:hypothetical protein [Pimelobacter simplex]|uniref:hypothetical protein n=1 Tax=Nocardioides simplex TaxID=2045 RepID=UPI0019321CC4|nr:hypothetical protein [Pimelobacter simplex]
MSRILLTFVVACALVLMVRGLGEQIHIENTSEAVRTARHGMTLIGWACVLLTGAAVWSSAAMRRSPWIAVGLMTPVVLCGGLTWLVPDSLWGVLAAVVAVPAAGAAGLVVLLVPGR